MSRASAAVRFPDGTVKFAIYNGTIDVMNEGLFDNPDDPWDAYYQRGKFEGSDACWPEPEGEPEDVMIYSDYGGGFYWPGKATRNAIIGPTYWDDFTDIAVDGQPEWWRDAIAAARVE